MINLTRDEAKQILSGFIYVNNTIIDGGFSREKLIESIEKPIEILLAKISNNHQPYVDATEEYLIKYKEMIEEMQNKNKFLRAEISRLHEIIETLARHPKSDL